LKGPTVTLLRQRFGTPEEMAAHLHPVENRTLLFFREPSLAASLAGGSKVLLDISFTSTEQQVILRGHVLGSITEGALCGLWLEFPDRALARKAGALVARKQKRIACDAMVQVRRGDHPHLGRLIDVSLGGARLCGLVGVQDGDELDLRVVSDNPDWPTELGRAQVVRLSPTEVGARFLRNETTSRLAITRLFSALQASWNAAPLVDHPAICCRGGPLIEPPLPHRKGRLSSGGNIGGI